jgi:hypothetical protein
MPVREVYKWRYGFGQTERLNFIKRVMPGRFLPLFASQ